MKTIRVHSLDHARIALAAAHDMGCPVRLLSPVGLQAGIGWWRALTRQAHADYAGVEFEAVLDCGPSAGLALSAIRSGAGPVALAATQNIFDKVADIAQQAGTLVVGTGAMGGGIVALDLLGMPDPSRACRDWLEAEDAAPEA